MIGVKCSHFRAKAAHSSRHLPRSACIYRGVIAVKYRWILASLICAACHFLWLFPTLSEFACFERHFVTETAAVPARCEREVSTIACCKQANSLNSGESLAPASRYTSAKMLAAFPRRVLGS